MGPADSPFNIAWLFGRISWTLTEYLLGVSIGQPDSPFNIVWLFGWISWILTQYSLGVSICQPDGPFNIAWSFGWISRTLTKYSLSVIIGQPDRPFPLEKLIHLLCIGLGRTCGLPHRPWNHNTIKLNLSELPEVVCICFPTGSVEDVRF